MENNMGTVLGQAFSALKQNQKASDWNDGCASKIKCPRRFSLAALKKITDDFSETNVIGSEGYGKVYKAMLNGGQMVAIKRAQQGSMRRNAGFITEVELLSRLRHNNLLYLIGFCVEKGERALVYDYIANGSLRDIFLGKTGIQLDWGGRVGIALGSARALAHLHYEANPGVIHRNVKSTNILVEQNLTAKVAHLDLARILDGGPNAEGNSDVSVQVMGTLGYLDPEYFTTQQLSEKSDVYSFGIVLLELVTALPPIHGGKFIVRLVKAALESGGISGLQEELMDPLLRESLLVGFERFVSLALDCVQELGFQRPSMTEVVKELESILQTEAGSFFHYAPTPPPRS